MGEEVRSTIGKAAKSMVVAPRRCQLLVWSSRIGKGLSPAQLLAADDFQRISLKEAWNCLAY